MAVSEKVLHLIKDIEQGKKIDTALWHWDEFSVEDRQHLFNLAEKPWLDAKKDIDFLQAFYRIALKDIPSKIKILQLVYLRTGTTAEIKKNVLETVKRDLENLRTKVKNADLFNLYSGEYLLLLVRDKEESGDIDRMLVTYQEAITYFNKAGAMERTVSVEREVENLKSQQKQRATLLPVALLLSQRSQLESDLAQLQQQVRSVHSETQQVQENLSALEETQNTLKVDIQNGKTELEKVKAEIDTLQTKYPSARTTLEFLLALPQAAASPLWVEVIRLAVNQGQMDELSLQALQRLAIPHPQDAIPLLAEIAARMPEPLQIEKELARTALSQWFVLIAQARQEMQANNQLQAAQTMLQAWDIFFNMKENK